MNKKKGTKLFGLFGAAAAYAVGSVLLEPVKEKGGCIVKTGCVVICACLSYRTAKMVEDTAEEILTKLEEVNNG